jgi:hypothetical protein
LPLRVDYIAALESVLDFGLRVEANLRTGCSTEVSEQVQSAKFAGMDLAENLGMLGISGNGERASIYVNSAAVTGPGPDLERLYYQGSSGPLTPSGHEVLGNSVPDQAVRVLYLAARSAISRHPNEVPGILDPYMCEDLCYDRVDKQPRKFLTEIAIRSNTDLAQAAIKLSQLLEGFKVQHIFEYSWWSGLQAESRHPRFYTDVVEGKDSGLIRR